MNHMASFAGLGEQDLFDLTARVSDYYRKGLVPLDG
jgi:hypothetical protein